MGPISRENSQIEMNKIIEAENTLIEQMATSPTSSQLARKVGAVVLIGLAASVAYILETIRTCGGLREKISCPEVGMLKSAWNSKPLSPEAAKKIEEAMKTIRAYHQNYGNLYEDLIREKAYTILWEPNDLSQAIIREEAHTILRTGSFAENISTMTSVLNGSSRRKFEEGIKKLRELKQKHDL